MHDVFGAPDRLADILQGQFTKQSFKMVLMLILIEFFKLLPIRPVERAEILTAVSQCAIAVSFVKNYPKFECKIAVA